MTQKPLKSPIKVTKYRKPWEVGTSMEPQRPSCPPGMAIWSVSQELNLHRCTAALC